MWSSVDDNISLYIVSVIPSNTSGYIFFKWKPITNWSEVNDVGGLKGIVHSDMGVRNHYVVNVLNSFDISKLFLNYFFFLFISTKNMYCSKLNITGYMILISVKSLAIQSNAAPTPNDTDAKNKVSLVFIYY